MNNESWTGEVASNSESLESGLKTEGEEVNLIDPQQRTNEATIEIAENAFIESVVNAMVSPVIDEDNLGYVTICFKCGS